MNLTAASQIVLDNSLVPPEARLKIGECNRRIEFSKPQRAATYQVTLDALKLSPCYLAFLITAGMLNEDILNSTAYKIYYAYASGAKEPKKARKFKKPVSPKLKIVLVSPKEPTKKPGKAKKDVTSTKKTSTKPKPTKKKASVKAGIGKGLNVLSEVALSKAAQLKEVTKQSKKDFTSL
nr:hypothetical protein [Tanacetum cinerariifolium]